MMLTLSVRVTPDAERAGDAGLVPSFLDTDLARARVVDPTPRRPGVRGHVVDRLGERGDRPSLRGRTSARGLPFRDGGDDLDDAAHLLRQVEAMTFTLSVRSFQCR